MTPLEWLVVSIWAASMAWLIADIIRQWRKSRRRKIHDIEVYIVHETGKPSHCKVWRGNHLIFEGESMEQALQELRRTEP